MSRQLKGKVLKIKMQKTVVVGVSTIHQHRLYHKHQRRVRRYLTHTDHKLKVGDEVILIETRPRSKNKHFRAMKVEEG